MTEEKTPSAINFDRGMDIQWLAKNLIGAAADLFHLADELMDFDINEERVLVHTGDDRDTAECLGCLLGRINTYVEQTASDCFDNENQNVVHIQGKQG